MNPTQFNLGQEVLRATEAWLAANQVGVPESIKHAAPQGSAIGEARSDSLAVAAPIHPDCEDRCQILEHKGYRDCSQTGQCIYLAVLGQPISGPCIECHQETEDRHDNAWMCDGCAEQLNEEYERDCRLDDPRHGQGG